MTMDRVVVVKNFTLNGTIDSHDPIGATFRIHGPQGPFRLTVISVNWGRGYEPGEFKRNVLNVLDRVDEKQYVVLLIQELDEGDEEPERTVLAGMLEPGSTRVQWNTKDPIVVSPGVPVRRQRKVMTMDAGLALGAPAGTGPRRFFTSCIATIQGVKIGLGNQHPHRNLSDRAVQDARRRGHRITRHEIAVLVDLCDLVIHGGDMNDTSYPLMHRQEKTAVRRTIDMIRYIDAR